LIQSRIFCGKYAGKEKSDNEVLYPDPDLIDFFSDFFCELKLHIRIQTGNKRADIVNTHVKKSQKIHTFLCKKVGVGRNCRERPDRHPYLPSVTELKNDCACVTGDPVGQSRSRLPSRRDIWRENIDLNNTFRMKDRVQLR